MTRKEIEQAIDNGDSVWVIYKNQSNVYEIKSNNIEKVLNDTFLWGKEYYANIKDVFKTKAEAEHYLHHANISRTEHLPFLTWEEFCEQKFIWFIDKNQNECCLYYLNVSNKIFINVSGEVKEIGDLTEENFYKAYDECVRLFKEEV